MKIMISAGEASGDLHGGNLAKMLKTLSPKVELFGMGGSAMEKAGVEILQEIDGLGVIGLVEGVKLLRKLFKIRDRMVKELVAREADALVVIDYSEYNLRLAKKAHILGVPVVFFISPSAWAWRKGRAKDVAKISERVAAIFPFEAEVYREAGAQVTEVGHPLIDVALPSMTRAEAQDFFKVDLAKKQVLMMPGSRKQEIENLLPSMCEAAKLLLEVDANLEFFLPLASTIPETWISSIIEKENVPVRIVREKNYDLMSICHVGMITSGTASLEAALLSLPAVIVYKVAPLSYFIGIQVVKLKYFGLPNIVSHKEIVPELLQSQVNGENIAELLKRWLDDEEAYKQVKNDLVAMKQALGGAGAIRRTAEVVLEVAQKKEKNK